MLLEEKTIASERIYQGTLVNLRIDTVKLPSGNTKRREIVEHGDVVVIIAIDSDNNVLLVNQFRKPVERALLEVPAGCIEPGESPSETALRELQEETGYTAAKIEKIGGFYSSPGFCTEYLHLYLATDLHASELEADEDEVIELVRVPLSQTPGLIKSGQICDAKSIAGLLSCLFLYPERIS